MGFENLEKKPDCLRLEVPQENGSSGCIFETYWKVWGTDPSHPFLDIFHTHTRAHAHTQTNKLVQLNVHTYTSKNTQGNEHIRTNTHIYKQTNTNKHTRVYKQAI